MIFFFFWPGLIFIVAIVIGILLVDLIEVLVGFGARKIMGNLEERAIMLLK